MRNIILAVAAAMALVGGAAPSLADNAGTSNIVGQCANILSKPTGYRAGMVADCHSGKKRQKPSAVRAAPVIRDDGPTITLPG
jgi:hypothetical protein